MIAKNTKEFQNKVLENMTFSPYFKSNYTPYMNKKRTDLGYFIKYSREGYYDFGIGDYTIPSNFSLSFDHNEIEINSSVKNSFTNQLNYGDIKIGTNRYITLSVSDAKAISEAHNIITKDPCNPPTIKALSKMVYLNEQKLKAGFLTKYHMSIKKYTNSLRMTMSENLLSTTDLSIDEISKKVGYNHSGNFVKMFKKTHGKTPLAFRKMKL